MQTGIAPQALLALDQPMFDALTGAIDDRWPSELELQAQTVETLSALLVAYISAHTSKRHTLEPVRIERPAHVTQETPAKPQPPRVSLGEFARLTGRASRGGEQG